MSLEQLSTAHVLVAFYGYTHDRLNLEGPAKIQAFLEERAQRTLGRRLVFLESASSTPKSVRDYKTEIKNFGSMAGVVLFDALTAKFGGEPTLQDGKKIESATQDEVVQDNLIPRDQLHAYFFARTIDELRKPNLGFEIEFEAHAHIRVSALDKAFAASSNYRAQARAFWENQQFDQMMQAHRRHFSIQTSHDISRDHEIINLLKPLIKSLSRNPNGGFIGIPYGRVHQLMIDDLRETFTRSQTVNFEVIDSPPNPRLIQMVRDLRTKEQVTDQVVAQDHFEEVLQQSVEKYTENINKLPVYARNFETIYAEVVAVVDSLDLETIRRICEEEIDPTKLLQQHPLATKTRELILT